MIPKTPPPVKTELYDAGAPPPSFTPLPAGSDAEGGPTLLAQAPGGPQSARRQKDTAKPTGQSDVQFASDALDALPPAKPLPLSVSDIALGLTPDARSLQQHDPVTNAVNSGARAAKSILDSVSNAVGKLLGVPPSATATGSSALFTQAMATVDVKVDPNDGSFTLPNDRRGGAMLAGAIAAGALPGDPTGTGFGGVAAVNRELLIGRGASLDFIMGYDAAVDQMANGLAQQTIRDLVRVIGAMAPYSGRKASAGPGLLP